MKFSALILVVGFFILNVSSSRSANATEFKFDNAKHCAELLHSFQNKISHGLRSELHSVHGNKKLTVFLLVTQDASPAIASRLQAFGIESVRSYDSVQGKAYLEVRGTKKLVQALMDDFKTREIALGVAELEWAGLRKRPTQIDSEIANSAPKYILVFDNQQNFEQANARFQEWGIAVIDKFVTNGNGKVTVLVQATEVLFEKASKLPGVQVAQKEIQHKLPDSRVPDPKSQPTQAYSQASPELRQMLTDSEMNDSEMAEVVFIVSNEGIEEASSRKEKIDISSARVQKVAAVLKGYEAEGLVIKNQFEALGMILVEAPMGLLRELLASAMSDVEQVTRHYSDVEFVALGTGADRSTEVLAKSLSVEAVTLVQERFLKSKYCNFAGFRSLSIAKNEAGAFILHMGVATDADLAGKPSLFEGVEVRYDVVGEIVALGVSALQPTNSTGGLAPISLSNVSHEVLLALANPDRNTSITLSLDFVSKADFDLFQEQLKIAGSSVDSFVLHELPYTAATIKGRPDSLNNLLSRLTESKPGMVEVSIPPKRKAK